MITAEYHRSREYRDQLRRALSVAKLKLPAADYARMEPGVMAEVRRIDEEIAKYCIEAYTGCNCEAIPRWSFISVAQTGSLLRNLQVNISFNSPRVSSPWTCGPKLEQTRTIAASHLSRNMGPKLSLMGLLGAS